MATRDLGLVGIVNKGTYNAAATYNTGMFVLYGGSTWLCIKDNTTNVTPAAGANWQLMALGISTLLDFSAYQGRIDTYTAVEGITTLGSPANNDQKLRYSLNADKSVGKLYGWLRLGNGSTDVTVGSGGRMEVGTNLKVKATGTAYQIVGISGQYITSDTGSTWAPVTSPHIKIAADGTVSFDFLCSSVAKTYPAITIYFPPCIYFFSDFGD